MKRYLLVNNWQWPLIMACLCLAIEWLFPQAAIAEKLLSQIDNKDKTMQLGTIQPVGTTDMAAPVLHFPVVGKWPARYVVHVPTTAYSSTIDQTDSTPFITASGTRVRPGVVAANFLPFGTRIRLPDYFGDQIFVVEDRMNERYHKRLDIWMASRGQAVDWGVRRLNVEVL